MDSMNRGPAGPALSDELPEILGQLRSGFAACPDPALIQAAQSQVLSPDIGELVIAHLESCALCRTLVQDLRQLDEQPVRPQEQIRMWNKIEGGIATDARLSETMGSPERLPHSALWNWLLRPLPVTIAAMVVLLVAGVSYRIATLPNRTAEQLQPASDQVAKDNSSASESTPATVASSVPPSKPSVLVLTKAPVNVQASALMVWRGQEPAGEAVRPNTPANDLLRALGPYQSGDYARTASRLEQLIKKYPRLPEARFYLGVSELFLERNHDAVESLKVAISLSGTEPGGSHQPRSPRLADDAAWYLALADHRDNNDAEARQLLAKLCRAGGKDAPRACAGLTELRAE